MQDAKIGASSIASNSVFPTLKGKKETISKEYNYFGKLILMIFATSCVVIVFSWIITKTRHDRLRMLNTKNILEKQVAALENENFVLEREQSTLKDDPIRIEKEAREQLGYIEPEEIIYERYNYRVKSTVRKEPATVAHQNHWKTFVFDGPFPWQVPALIILFASAYYVISYHYEYKKLHRPHC